jgi:hypothetical protein
LLFADTKVPVDTFVQWAAPISCNSIETSP